MKRFFCNTMLFLLVAFAAAGCLKFDYTGQSFEPLSDSSPVAVFKDKAAVPAGDYRIIGRGVLSGSNEIDSYDRMAELRAQARKHGADAICLLGTRNKLVGVFPAGGDNFGEPLSAISNRGNVDPSGKTWAMSSFGVMAPLKNQEEQRYEFEMQVLFLKKSTKFDAEMKKRPALL